MRYIMRSAFGLACVTALGLTLCGPGLAHAEVLDPTDARGIRELPGQNPFLLDFLSINHSVEDRTVLEFALGGLSGPVTSATLDLDLRNLDPGLPGIIDVYTFAGSGVVTANLFSAGPLFTSFPNSASGLEHVDVTAAFLAAQAAGEAFLGFQLSTATDSRYLLGPPFTGSGPTLTAEIVPEPGTLALFGLGTLGIALTFRLLALKVKLWPILASRLILFLAFLSHLR
jgi:hypothetical protein